MRTVFLSTFAASADTHDAFAQQNSSTMHADNFSTRIGCSDN